MRAARVPVVPIILLAASAARAEPAGAKSTPIAPSKLVGAYRRAPGNDAARDLTADKGSSCGAEARAAVRKMADSVASVTVLASSIVINTGKQSAITFATQEAAMSNVVLDRDDRFTTALRLTVVNNGLTITYNKVERETADWCSDTWGVLLQRN